MGGRNNKSNCAQESPKEKKKKLHSGIKKRPLQHYNCFLREKKGIKTGTKKKLISKDLDVEEARRLEEARVEVKNIYIKKNTSLRKKFCNFVYQHEFSA